MQNIQIDQIDRVDVLSTLSSTPKHAHIIAFSSAEMLKENDAVVREKKGRRSEKYLETKKSGKKAKLILTKKVLAKRLAEKLAKMSEKEKKGWIQNVSKHTTTMLKAHGNMQNTTGKMTAPDSSDLDADNILYVMSQVYSDGMDTQSLNEVALANQTEVDQKVLAAQQNNYADLDKQIDSGRKHSTLAGVILGIVVTVAVTVSVALLLGAIGNGIGGPAGGEAAEELDAPATGLAEDGANRVLGDAAEKAIGEEIPSLNEGEEGSSLTKEGSETSGAKAEDDLQMDDDQLNMDKDVQGNENESTSSSNEAKNDANGELEKSEKSVTDKLEGKTPKGSSEAKALEKENFLKKTLRKVFDHKAFNNKLFRFLTKHKMTVAFTLGASSGSLSGAIYKAVPADKEPTWMTQQGLESDQLEKVELTQTEVGQITTRAGNDQQKLTGMMNTSSEKMSGLAGQARSVIDIENREANFRV